MAEPVAPVTPEVPQNTETKPENPVSAAAKTLAQARADLKAKAKEATKAADPKATAADAASTAVPSVPSKTDAAGNAGDKPGSPDDDVKQNLAELARIDAERKFKARQDKLDAQAKDLEAKAAAAAELEPLKAAKARIKETQPGTPERAKALLDLIGNDLTIDDLHQLSALAGQERPPLTREEAVAIAKEELRAAAEAEKKRQEDEKKARDAEISQKELAIVKNNAIPFLAANADKYRTVAFRGVSEERVIGLMREGYRETGQLPEWDDIFGYLEDEFRKEAQEKLAPVFVQPPKPPMRTIGAEDRRGPAPIVNEAPAPKPQQSLQEARQAFKERVRQQLQQAAR